MKAVAAENVSKKFVVRTDRPKNLADGLRGLLFRSTRRDFWALKDVSFDVEQGEAVGIIGHNGAGKSTMLKILTGLMLPTSGRIRTRGRVSALIEVGAGFHPEMTGRENVYLNGTILGMTRSEISRKLDAIVSFAELEEFIDTPVKRYSSGMYARLGFSVAAHVEPQVLLVDEVLAVGDLVFQEKCFRHMQSLAARGCAVILVTHSMHSAKQICRRLIWIHQGQVRMSGPSESVVQEYQLWASTRSNEIGGGGLRWGSGAANIRTVSCSARPNKHRAGTDVDITMDVEAARPIDGPVFWVMITDSTGQKIGGTSTRRQPGFLPVLDGRCVISCSISGLPLVPGVYNIIAGVFDSSLVPLDRWGNCASFVVEPAERFRGLLTPDFDGSVWTDSTWRSGSGGSDDSSDRG